MPKMLDLTGNRFGKLVALKPDGKDAYNRYYWLCKCECGNEVRVKANNLRTGNSKSCGCEKSALGKCVKDLAGRTFGELTVLERDMTRLGKGKVFWLCRCDCGEVVSVWMAGLLRGKNVTCAVRGNHAESDSWLRKLWADKVKARSGYKCQRCENKENLHAHHILSFTAHPDVKFEVGNGACLCESCHQEFHSLFGVLGHSRDDFSKYVSRATHKGGTEDLRKAGVYLGWAVGGE